MRALGPGLVAVMLLLGCPEGGGGGDGGAGGGKGGGAGGGGGGEQNQGVLVVDPTATERLPLAMAVGPNDRVGIAYFVRVGPSQTRPSVSDYDLRYVEWQNGTLSAAQKVTTVQRVFGVALAFAPSGEPAVSYLGGGDDQSTYWFQSDAVVSRRSGGTTWTESTIATRGDYVACGGGTCATTSDRGFLVGLNPGLVFLPNGDLFVGWRDGHDGQFPQQDWAASDFESARGQPGSWTPFMVAAGGSTAAKPGWGGHIQMILGAANQPVAVSDYVLGSADGFGASVQFHRFTGTGWAAAQELAPASAQTNNQTGPSIAYRQGFGYGVAYVNANTTQLFFRSSNDGTSWTIADQLPGSGTFGWYPSVGIDPVLNQPSIAYYICSTSTGVAEGTCPAELDKLVLATRIPSGTDWQEQVIDTEGGYLPKLGYLSNDKRVIAYRHPTTFQVKLFVEP